MNICQELRERCKSLATSDLSDTCEIKEKIVSIESSIRSNYKVLSAYDQKKMFEDLSAVKQNLKEFQEKTRKAFKFRAKEKDRKVTYKTDERTETVVFKSNGIKYNDKKNEKLEIGGSNSTFEFNNCESCIIRINDASNVILSNMKNCEIKLDVKTSCFVDNCSGCTITVKSHQLRIHNTLGCTFYCDVLSEICLEKSKEIIFSFLNSGNKKINDFNWLSDEKSPNYEIK